MAPRLGGLGVGRGTGTADRWGIGEEGVDSIGEGESKGITAVGAGRNEIRSANFSIKIKN